VTRLSLSDKAYDLIKGEILTCSLEPGQQIAQQQLAERYQLGLTPIREALQRLAQEGFMTSIPRFGYVVTPITLSDVHEIFELRAILESAAARLAAQRGTDEQLDEFARAADFTYVHKDPQSYPDFLALNADFHRSLALIAGNGRLADQISRGLDELTRVFHLGLDLRDSAEEMREEHLALAGAICSRDADQAEAVVQSQIQGSRQRVLEALTRRLGGDPHEALRQVVQIEPASTS
jgi:DNA-binding GntR family transcriptional regulator